MNTSSPAATWDTRERLTSADQATIDCLNDMDMGQLRDILTSTESPAVRAKAVQYFEMAVRRDQLSVILPKRWQK